MRLMRQDADPVSIGPSSDVQGVRVGKRVGPTVYVDPDAIGAGLSKLNEKQMCAYARATEMLGDYLKGSRPNRFPHEIVQIGSGTVRFLQMSSLCEPHPYALRSLKIDFDSRSWTPLEGRGRFSIG
jgi:hypothetical protein